MRLTIDPMTAIRTHAEWTVNSQFNTVGLANTHLDQEYQAKRKAAQAVLAGEVSDHLNAEATLMGVSPESLARSILDKPDTVLERGLKRRRAILEIRAATSWDQVQNVLDSLNLIHPCNGVNVDNVS